MHIINLALLGPGTVYQPPDIVAATKQKSQASTLSIARPSTTTAGDILLCAAVNDDGKTATEISGWTEDAESTIAGGGGIGIQISHKTAASEPDPLGSIVWTNSQANVGICVAFRNAALDVVGTPVVQDSFSGSLVIPGITVGYKGSLLLAVVAYNATNTLTTDSGISGMSLLADWDIGDGNGPFVAIHYKAHAAGASGDQTWSPTVSASRACAGVLVSVRRA